MNKLISGLLAFVLLANANAGTTGTIEATNTEGFYSGQNLVQNAGAEVNTKGWTASGGTLARSTTTPDRGDGVLTWDSNGAAQTLMSASVTIPSGLYGKNGVVSCPIKCASGTCTHQLMAYDGTTELGATTITSSTSQYARTTVNFGSIPSSGSIRLRLKSVAADEPSISVGECLLGDATGFNLSQVNQAQFVGSAYFAMTASCTWSSTGTGSYAAFSTTSACPGPTIEANPGVGVIQTTDTDLPKVTVNNLPNGEYTVIVSTNVQTITSNNTNSIVISDGSTVSGYGSAVSTTGIAHSVTIVGHFSYTSAGNKTFELQSRGSAAGVRINNNIDGQITRFEIYRFPTSSELAYRPEMMPGSWSGYTTVSGGCSTASATYADTSACTSIALTQLQNSNFGSVTTAGSSLPGITFTPTKTGSYNVCANIISTSTATSSISARLVDGSGTVVNAGTSGIVNGATALTPITLCGIYRASSTAASTIKAQLAINSGTASILNGQASGTPAINWTIFPSDQGFPAPLSIGSVTSDSSGSENIGRATIAEGANCTTGACTINRQSGSWLTSFTWSTTGVYNLVFKTGFFSGPPTCVGNHWNGTLIQNQSPNTATTTSLTAIAPSAAANSRDFHIICVGPR